ncbi:MAG: YgiQ family radical SAM protein [Rikenellaceae bacterium]|nr:YgiQ family radical SAM protein [Rikenellaceae bacterium]MCL2693139.1 YgiQ family radical SAM protein [Rikenellaceae bacterium]
MSTLPTTVKEMRALGWDAVDAVLVTGDAYVDHPSFGAAVVGRLLEAEGLRVAVVAQPNWSDDLRDFRKFGAPRLFFGVTSGAMDSMVCHYTAHKRLRSDDAYTAGGEAGRRPDRAVTVYSQILKRLYPHTPVVVGGIEASLRRLAHYDYWDDRLRPSILTESGADLLVYGMADRTIVEVVRAMRNGFNAKLLRRLRQVAFVADGNYVARLDGALMLNSFERCVADPAAFAENFVRTETESNRLESDTTLVERVGDSYIIVNPPHPTLTESEIDRSFDLPYARLPHPRYDGKGAIPAFEMIKFSVNLHRGCFGGCSFCAISAHQGKFVVSRSERSVLAEVDRITKMPDFKGYLSDLGGPSANMYGMAGRDKTLCAKCLRPSCAWPSVCRNLDRSHARMLSLYAQVRARKGIKKAFIGSGIRYDLFENDGGRYLREVVVNHTSGRLKVAPEHTEDTVLRLMRKPPFGSFVALADDVACVCRAEGISCQVVPYFISSHPGCTERDMRRLSEKTRRLGCRIEQVQDLTPTPMTLSSVMFYCGFDPYTGEKLYVARSMDEKRKQKKWFFK